MSLVSDSITGEFKMAVDPSLRVKNMYVLLGNYTMGGIVYPRPVVTLHLNKKMDRISFILARSQR